jgi:hypothetical protein
LNLLLSTNGGALKYVEQFIGRGKLRKPNACQIALRFPEDCGSSDYTKKLSGREWHVDGMRQGKRNPFSLLLGIALTTCPDVYCGNFTVFPKSHDTIHSLILENGRLKGIDEHRLWSVATDPNNPWCQQEANHIQEGEGEGEEGEEKETQQQQQQQLKHSKQPKLPDLGASEQLCLNPGDIILAHPKLAHRGAPNLSSNIRYMIYFRLKHILHGENQMQKDLITNMYSDLDCVDKCHNEMKMRRRNQTTVIPSSLPSPLLHGPALPIITPSTDGRVLSASQIDTFKKYGVLVVPNVLTKNTIAQARRGLSNTLKKVGVDTATPSGLSSTCHRLKQLSSTNGAGGVLDVFYEEWKLNVTLNNPKYKSIVLDLYNATYNAPHPVDPADPADPADQTNVWKHPYGTFDRTNVWAHIDRIGYRLPDAMNCDSTGKKNTIQRSLTPQ